MATAKKGDKVRIDYIARLDDGTIFDTTLENEECNDASCESDDCGCGCEEGPMDLTIGDEEFFPQIEEALIGMAVGETKTVHVPSDEAFGDYDAERVFTVPKSDLPDDMNPEVGQEMILTGDDDESLGVTVVEVTDETVTFDANHPLAGEDLSFEVTLVEIA